jgi:hypothetical protein
VGSTPAHRAKGQGRPSEQLTPASRFEAMRRRASAGADGAERSPLSRRNTGHDRLGREPGGPQRDRDSFAREGRYHRELVADPVKTLGAVAGPTHIAVGQPGDTRRDRPHRSCAAQPLVKQGDQLTQVSERCGERCPKVWNVVTPNTKQTLAMPASIGCKPA